MAKKNGKNGKKNGLAKVEAAPLAERVGNMFGYAGVPQIPVDAPLPHITILRETPSFEMPDGKIVPEFEGHILWYHNANQYYPDAFGEGEVVPQCASSDGIMPDGGLEQMDGPCRGCPLNEFGSALEGRGKACSNTIRFYLLVDGDILPSILKAPPSSLGNKDRLMKWLVSAPSQASKAGFGGVYQPLKVRFSLHTKDFNSGMSASVIDVETTRALDVDVLSDYALMTTLADMTKQIHDKYAQRIREDVAGEITEEVPI